MFNNYVSIPFFLVAALIYIYISFCVNNWKLI